MSLIPYSDKYLCVLYITLLSTAAVYYDYLWNTFLIPKLSPEKSFSSE